MERDTCTICLEEIKVSSSTHTDGCDHSFCFTCIKEWCRTSNVCPLCKTRIKKLYKYSKKKLICTNIKDTDERLDNAFDEFYDEQPVNNLSVQVFCPLSEAAFQSFTLQYNLFKSLSDTHQRNQRANRRGAIELPLEQQEEQPRKKHCIR